MAEKPGGRPSISTRIGPSKPSIRFAETLNSRALPGADRGLRRLSVTWKSGWLRADVRVYLKSGPCRPRTSLILTRYSPSAGAVKCSRESLPSSRWPSSSLSK